MSRIKTHNHHFRVMYSKEDMEDILSYNKILDYIKHESNSEDGPLWQYVISIHFNIYIAFSYDIFEFRCVQVIELWPK